MEKQMPSDSQPPVRHTRGADRRCNKHIGPPPYYTREGKVLAERRSPFDRRATWIREYSLDTAGNGNHHTET